MSRDAPPPSVRRRRLIPAEALDAFAAELCDSEAT